jgi:hypothetical protein
MPGNAPSADRARPIAGQNAVERYLFSLGRPEWAPGRPGGHSVRSLLVGIGVGGGIYGLVIGTFQLTSPERALLVAYSAVKVPALIMLTTAICLPAYFVLNTILGLRQDFPRALRAVLVGQTALTAALASLAPLVIVAYAHGITHGRAQLASALNFLLATGMSQVVLVRHYRALIDEDPPRGPRHRVMLWVWVVMYAFVGIQLGWILRPYIGVPGLPVQFFREDAFSNAYVYFLRLVLRGGV